MDLFIEENGCCILRDRLDNPCHLACNFVVFGGVLCARYLLKLKNQMHLQHICCFSSRKDKDKRYVGCTGTRVVNADSCQCWFVHFHSGNENLAYAGRSYHPSTTGYDQILAAIRVN